MTMKRRYVMDKYLNESCMVTMQEREPWRWMSKTFRKFQTHQEAVDYIKESVLEFAGEKIISTEIYDWSGEIENGLHE